MQLLPPLSTPLLSIYSHPSPSPITQRIYRATAINPTTSATTPISSLPAAPVDSGKPAVPVAVPEGLGPPVAIGTVPLPPLPLEPVGYRPTSVEAEPEVPVGVWEEPEAEGVLDAEPEWEAVLEAEWEETAVAVKHHIST